MAICTKNPSTSQSPETTRSEPLSVAGAEPLRVATLACTDNRDKQPAAQQVYTRSNRASATGGSGSDDEGTSEEASDRCGGGVFACGVGRIPQYSFPKNTGVN
jgi:hypothetical protein